MVLNISIFPKTSWFLDFFLQFSYFWIIYRIRDTTVLQLITLVFDSENLEISDDRIELLNRVNSCLIERINFGHINGGYDLAKIESFKTVIERLADSAENAEFVLQVALYARRALNIRTAANYILAVAACHANTKGWTGLEFLGVWTF